MFRAGQVAAPRTSVLWPAATGVLGAAVVSLAVLLVAQSGLQQTVRIIEAQRPALVLPPPLPERIPERVPVPPPQQAPESSPVSTEAEPSDVAYLRMQEQVLHWGLEALPAAPPETGADAQLPPITVERAAGSAAQPSRVSNFLRFFQ